MLQNKITQVQKRDGTIVKFDQDKIYNAIFKAITATGQGDGEQTKKISDRVIKILHQRFKKNEILQVEQIQDIVEEVLILEGFVKTAKAYILYREQRRKIREAVLILKEEVERVDQYLEKLDWEVKENANMAFSLQGLNQYAISNIIKKYWLNKIYPKEIREANESGDFHLHDLNTLGLYCAGWDLSDLLLQGFGGVPDKVSSKPPKHFRAALGQVTNFLFTVAGEVAGAVAFSNFDTLMSPFIRYDNLDYRQTKQALQEFLFNMATPTRVGFQCVSQDTKILTPEGWKGYDEIKEGDIIKTFNLKTKEVEDKKVDFVFKRKYQGIMYRLQNRIQDQLISPEHRIVRRKFYSDKYVLQPIEEVRRLKFPFIIPMAGKNPNPEANITDEQIKLMAWIISEGSVERPGKHRCCYRVSIYQSKIKNRENYDEIINLLKNFNLAYTNHPATSLGEEVQQIRLNAEDSRKIHQWFGTRENIHFIPEYLFNLSERQSRLFLQTYLRGDGKEGCKITTSDLGLLSDLQHIIVNAEYGFTVRKQKASEIGKKDIYILRIIRHPETYITKIDKVNYEGIIWCPHTDNGTIIARRKGKVFITGNCPFTNITLDLKPSPVFAKMPVIIGGKPQKEIYEEFGEEMKMFNKAFYEAMLEGDKDSRPFSFPIPTINITKNFPWTEPAFDGLFEASAKYGINYFCLLGDTLVEKFKDGSTKIETIKPGDSILTEHGYKTVKEVFRLRSNEIIEILLKNGVKIKATPNHQFPLTDGSLKRAEDLTLSNCLLSFQPKKLELNSGVEISLSDSNELKIFTFEENKLKEKKFEEIKKGDTVFLKPNLKFENITSFGNFTPISYASGSKPNSVKIPQSFSPELARLLGYLIGDGYYYGSGKNLPRITFVNTDEEVLKDFKRIVRKLFGFSFSLSEGRAGKSKKAKEIEFSSTILRQFLYWVGLDYLKRDNKEIPEIIFKTTKENIINFLKGLFETDGSISPKGDIFLTLSSKKVIYGTQKLLLKLGILSKTRFKKREGYQIQILGRYAKEFTNKIGFVSQRKKKRYKKELFKNPCLGDYRNLSSSILILLNQIKNKGEKMEKVLQYVYEKVKYRSRGRVTPEDLRVVIEKLRNQISLAHTKTYQTLKFILENNLFCDKVISNHPQTIEGIEIFQIKKIEGDFEVYDLTIDSPTHLFIIEGKILTHNSNYINSDMSPEDVRSMCKLPSTEIIYRNANGEIAKTEIRRIVDDFIKRGNSIAVLINGKFKPVKDIIKLRIENEEILKVTLDNGIIDKMTLDHPSLIIKNEKLKKIESRYLKVGDEFPISKYPYKGELGDFELGRLVGLYAGDGWISHNNATLNYVFGIQEKNLIEFIQKIAENKFIAPATVYFNKKHKYCRISIGSRALVELIKEYVRGSSSLNKRLNSKAYARSIEFRKGVLIGILESDGFIKKGVVVLHSGNRKFVLDVFILARSLGVNTTYFESKNKTGDKRKIGYNLRFTNDYPDWLCNYFKLKKGRSTKYNNYTNFYGIKIIKIEKVKYTGYVYDFEINSRDHSFQLANGVITHNCCRLRLDMTELHNRGGGGLFGSGANTGSIGVVTIGLPRIGYLSKTKKEFFERLGKVMDLAQESLEIKRKTIEDFINKGLYPYSRVYLQGIKKMRGTYYANHFTTIGLVGMNEALVNFIGDNIASNRGRKFAVEILDFMREKLVAYQEKTGNIYNLEATPAESSLAPNEKVLISQSDPKLAKIGPLIDGYFKRNKEKIRLISRSEVLPLDKEELYTYGFSKRDQKIKKYPITALVRHSGDSLYEIETASGRKVKVTKYHSIFTINEEGVPCEIKVENLQTGDPIAIPKRIEMENIYSDLDLVEKFKTSPFKDNLYIKVPLNFLEKLILNEEVRNWAKNYYAFDWRNVKCCWKKNQVLPYKLICDLNIFLEKEISKNSEIFYRETKNTFPTKVIIQVDKNLGFILGSLLAEGWIESDRMEFANTNKKIIKELTLAFEKSFGEKSCRLYFKKDNRGYRSNYVLVVNKMASLILREIFGLKGKSGKKSIPSFVYFSSEDLIKGLVKGFALGDGFEYSNKKKRDYTYRLYTNSKELMEGLNVLLLKLGILAKIRIDDKEKQSCKWKKNYILSISGSENLKKFYDFVIEKRFKGKLTNSGREIIPKIVKPLKVLMKEYGLRTKNLKELKIHKDSLNRNIKTNRISHHYLKEILEKIEGKINTSLIRNLKVLIDGDLYWDPIKSIRKIKTPKYVYDFEVDVDGDFVQNFLGGEGLVCLHNTAYRLAQKDKSKFPDIITAGTKEVPFYTNSTALPVNYTDDLFEALKLQDEILTKYTGGCVHHVFLGERMPDAEAVKKLVKKIFEEFHLPYITITPTFCYDSRTEVLTKNGWKFIKNVKIGEEVMTVNPETKILSYQRVARAFEYDYKGKMIHFKAKQKGFDCLVTPNHQMFIKPKSIKIRDLKGKFKKPKEYKYFEIADEVNFNTKVPLGGFIWKGKCEKFFVLSSCNNNKKSKFAEQIKNNIQNGLTNKEISDRYNCSPSLVSLIRHNKRGRVENFREIKISMNRWLKFFGIWLAEGYARVKPGRGGEVYIAQRNREIRKEIENLLKQLPFNYTKDYRGFYIYSLQLASYLLQFNGSRKKYIPTEIKQLDKDQLKILIDWYFKGDGTKGSNYIASFSPQLKDDLQELYLKIGFHASIRKHIITKRISKHAYIGYYKKKINYNGKIYDVEVEKNHVIYVRRNGFPVFSSNSICPSHGYLSGEYFDCPKCIIKQPCEVYSRIVGYIRPINQWNTGKQQEFKERKEFKLPIK